jgi:hypothetical protein
MKQLMSFPLESGGEIWIETDYPSSGGYVNSSAGGHAAAKATQTFESALEKLTPALHKIRDVLVDLNNPQEIEIEFGIKVSGEVGAFLTSASTEANLTVKLKWVKEPK